MSLREAEYRDEVLDKAGMSARHLNFAVRGDYFQMRRFLSSALRETPSLSLDALSFQQSRESRGLLDVKVALTLYMSN